MKKQNKIHEDCPFSQEDIDELQSELYLVASANNIPVHPTWVKGFNRTECRKVHDKNDAYKDWLEKELKMIKEPTKEVDSQSRRNDCDGFSPYWCDGIDCNECKCFMQKRIKEEQTEINFN